MTILPNLTRCVGRSCLEAAHCQRYLCLLWDRRSGERMSAVADYSNGLNGVGSRQ